MVCSKVTLMLVIEYKQNESIATIDNPTNENNTVSNSKLTSISKENLTAASPALQQLKQNIQFAESKYQQDVNQANRYKRLYESQSVAKSGIRKHAFSGRKFSIAMECVKKQYEQLLQQAKQNNINSETNLKQSGSIKL